MFTKHGASRHNTFLLWAGPSAIDGAPIGLFVSGLANRSRNRKTGAMVQTYIMRLDVDPVQAIKLGLDGSICGTGKNRCPHMLQERTNAAGKVKLVRTCYVNVGQGPLTIWRAWERGNVPMPDIHTVQRAIAATGRPLRMGAYGDPAAIPQHVWESILPFATGRTGYTHQWNNKVGWWLKGTVMASCDSPSDHWNAVDAGWGTFTVLPHENFKLLFSGLTRTTSCPSDPRFKDLFKPIPCNECLKCDGTRNVAIRAHGPAERYVTLTKLL
jgi:hypothetical protein